MGCGASTQPPLDDNEVSSKATAVKEIATRQPKAEPEPPEHLVEVDFSDLFTGPGYHIPQTEMRATSLDQLDLVMKHVTRRLTGGEVWKVSRFQNGQMVQQDLTEPAAVQLYDVNTHAIIPATAALQLSLIEAMATSPQKPSYFVSHWWGEEVPLMIRCLQQHSKDRALKRQEQFFWICAYANNQHKLKEEIGDGDQPLSETSFFRAMKLARGTVSVVDANGMSWTRIWCVYELFQSLTRMSSEYTYDIYTALEHKNFMGEQRLVVGITHGVAAVDSNVVSKTCREQHFPIELIYRGVTFCCENGNASVESDKHKIMAEIGTDVTLLNDTVHGVVAAAALERVLKENSDSRHDFLEAVKRSPPRELKVDLRDSAGDTQENVTAVIEALAANGASKCEVLRLYSEVATEIPNCLGELTALRSLDLTGCSSLVSLPESMGQMTALKVLKLYSCSSLVSLPESMGQMTTLKK